MKKPYAKPKEPHIIWSEQELGVIIHSDIWIFEPEFEFVDRNNFGKRIPLEKYNPPCMDTDQWLETAHKLGAKYAVLVAKHCTGFSMWPTKAHDYHIGNTPYKKDIVGPFIESCKKYGIKPGLYCSTVFNLAFGVDVPGKVVKELGIITQEEYNKMVETMVTELWTQYGDLFEIWFDGGTLPVDQGGPDLAGLIKKYQPNAICFAGPGGHDYNVRWVFNEDGKAYYDCWCCSGAPIEPIEPDDYKYGVGNPDSLVWEPAECDMPNRKLYNGHGGWDWKENEDFLLYSTSELVERYFKSVGRNTNLLLGMLVNTSGRVPDADVRQFTDFAEAIRPFRTNPIAAVADTGDEVILDFGGIKTIDCISISEELRYGQRVRGYDVYVMSYGEWKKVFTAKSIGNKRLIPLRKTECSSVKLVVSECVDTPVIRDLSVYFGNVEKYFDPEICHIPGKF